MESLKKLWKLLKIHHFLVSSSTWVGLLDKLSSKKVLTLEFLLFVQNNSFTKTLNLVFTQRWEITYIAYNSPFWDSFLGTCTHKWTWALAHAFFLNYRKECTVWQLHPDFLPIMKVRNGVDFTRGKTVYA